MADTVKCPYCKSDSVKKRFIGLPKLFFVSPRNFGILLIISGSLTIITGINKPNGNVEIVVGSFITVIAILGLGTLTKLDNSVCFR
jgi:hypothetical protein